MEKMRNDTLEVLERVGRRKRGPGEERVSWKECDPLNTRREMMSSERVVFVTDC